MHSDAKPANNCVRSALLQRQPFRVRYDQAGIDSEVAYSLVRTPKGKVLEIHYDSDPSGGSRRGEFIAAKDCPKPTKLVVSQSGTLTCFSPR